MEIDLWHSGSPELNAPILVSARAQRNPDGSEMSDKKRHTVTTIETHEFWIVRRPAQESPAIMCAACPDPVVMLTPQEAARRAGVSQRTVYRWVEDGRIHFAETADGSFFVCLTPLLI